MVVVVVVVDVAGFAVVVEVVVASGVVVLTGTLVPSGTLVSVGGVVVVVAATVVDVVVVDVVAVVVVVVANGAGGMRGFPARSVATLSPRNAARFNVASRVRWIPSVYEVSFVAAAVIAHSAM
jgi:hypothetical protein